MKDTLSVNRQAAQFARASLPGTKPVSVFALCALLLASGAAVRAATWDGGVAGSGTDWGVASNWVGDTLPSDIETISFNSTNPSYGYPVSVTNGSATVTNINTFGLQVGQAVTGVGITAGTTIVAIGSSTITLSNPFTGVTGSGPITVTNVGGLASSPTISLGASRTLNTLSLNNSNTFTLGSASDISSNFGLTLTNVVRGGSTAMTIAANVNLVANVTGKSTWRDSSNGTTTVTGAVGSTGDVILTKGGSTGTVVMNGANTFTGSVVVDAGTLSLGGTNAYTGSTTASGGTLTVNFNAGVAATPTSDIINSSSALVLGGVRGGGTVTTNGKAGATVSQSFNGTTLNAGASSLTIANGSTANTRTLVNLGAITRNAGSTVNFVQPTGTGNTTVGATNGYTTSTGNDDSGILGGYATVGGTDWATNNGTNIVAYTGYTTLAGATPNIVDGANTNVSITSGSTGDVGQAGGTITVNTLRVNDATARTITVGAGNILRLGVVGGVLSTGTNGLTIGASGNAGTLTAGGADDTAGELILNNSTALTINSDVANNGTGAVALTKSGSGTLTLNGTNTYTGGTVVNGGTLALVAGSTNPLANTGAITVTGGTLALGAGTNQTTTGAITLAGGTITGGTLTNNGSALDARNGTITAALAGSGGITKTTAGTLTIVPTVNNTFTGTTTILEGGIVAGNASDTGKIAIGGNLVVGSVAGGNSASYSVATNSAAWATGKTLTVYSNGSVNFGNGAQNINGAAVINIIGGSVTGTQIYTNTGATYNLTGGTLTGSFFSAGASYNVLASSETSTIGIGTSAGSQTFNVADGAAATDLTYTGSLGGANNLTKNGVGLMLASGSSSYTGITTVSGGTLAVTTLANGGSNSAIGAATNAADRLRLGNGTTFQYTGSGHSTDRLFTVNGSAAGHSATLDASGTGAANFTNTGSIAWGTTAQTRTLKLGGTSTANNTLSALIANNGSGAVAITKEGVGKWILANANTYGGATTVSAGTLALGANNAIGASSAISLDAGTLDLQTFSTTAASLSFNGGSTLKFNLGTPGNVTALLALSGNLDPGLGLGAYTLDFSGSGAEGTYNLISYAGTFFGDVSEFTVMNLGAGLTGELFLGSNLLSLTVTAVPEPSTYAVIVGLLALATVTCRRSRRRS